MRTILTAAVVVLFSKAALAQQPLPPGAGLPPNHPPVARPAAAQQGSALQNEAELLKELDATPGLKDQEKNFQVASSLGKLYYSNGRFEDALVFLRQAETKGEPMRALYLEQRQRAQARKLDLPSAQSAGCAPDPKAQLEQQLQAVRALVKAGQTAKAATCARVAVEPVVEVHELIATSLLLTGDKQGALDSANKAVELAPDNAQARYARGALLLEARGDEVEKLKQAKADFEAYLQLRPDGRHAAWVKQLARRVEEAIAAGGTTSLSKQAMATSQAPAPVLAVPAPGGDVGPVSKEAMEAIVNTERTPELVAGLAKLVEEAEEHLAHGRFQDALDNYRRVVPFDPDNGRARAGMAWALVGAGRQPMADRVWGVAVSTDPASVDALGTTLKAKGDARGASALWTKLAASDPAYAARVGLSARIGQ